MMESFKRLSPYVGPNIPEEVRRKAKRLWPDNPSDPGAWGWDTCTGVYQCSLPLWDMDADSMEVAGLVSIVPLEDGIAFTKADYEARFKEVLERGR
jgi:hypothetical protein